MPASLSIGQNYWTRSDQNATALTWAESARIFLASVGTSERPGKPSTTNATPTWQYASRIGKPGRLVVGGRVVGDWVIGSWAIGERVAGDGADRPPTAYEALRAHWEAEIFPKRNKEAHNDFVAFWEGALHEGFVEVDLAETAIGEFNTDAIRPLDRQNATDAFTLVLYSKVSMPDSRHAHNPWLHELPDPVSKVTWGNYVCVSPGDAKLLGLEDGDMVQVSSGEDGVQLVLPALVQVGQHAGVLAIALAYGRKGTDRFAKIGPQWFEARPTVPKNELVGKNAAGFMEFRAGTRRTLGSGVTLTKTGKRRELAVTQKYNSLDVPPEVAPHGAEHREIVEHTTLAAFAKDAHAGAAEHHFDGDTQLWPEDHPKTGPPGGW